MAKSKFKILQSPKGMHDILPQNQQLWDKIYRELNFIASNYNFMRIETPILEFAEVFEKSLGATSDIVEKQMFTLKSGGGDRLVLRPENTASIVRAYVQHGLSHLGQPLKLFYSGPMFRKEQPQAGRFRQFHQAGFEIISSDSDPVYDAQIILAMQRFLERLKIKDISLHINSIGCRVCRPNYRKKLTDYYKTLVSGACGDCRRRFKQNPLRLLDCKNEDCRELKMGAPIMLDSLCSTCSKYLKGVLEFLDELKLPYQMDNFLVRGLDYYNRTAFEFFTETVIENEKIPLIAGEADIAGDQKLFAKSGPVSGWDFALGGGGRYDYLFEMFGNRQSVGVGGAFGLERLVEVMKATKVNLGARNKPGVFFMHIGDYAKKRSLALIESLRDEGIPVKESLGKDSLGAQLRSANKEEADYALIFGQKEAFEESIIIRDLKNSVQETVPLKKLVAEIKKKITIGSKAYQVLKVKSL